MSDAAWYGYGVDLCLRSARDGCRICAEGRECGFTGTVRTEARSIDGHLHTGGLAISECADDVCAAICEAADNAEWADVWVGEYAMSALTLGAMILQPHRVSGLVEREVAVLCIDCGDVTSLLAADGANPFASVVQHGGELEGVGLEW